MLWVLGVGWALASCCASPRILVGGSKNIYIYWLVVWNIFHFSIYWEIIIPTDFHIFQRGRCTTKQIKNALLNSKKQQQQLDTPKIPQPRWFIIGCSRFLNGHLTEGKSTIHAWTHETDGWPKKVQIPNNNMFAPSLRTL